MIDVEAIVLNACKDKPCGGNFFITEHKDAEGKMIISDCPCVKKFDLYNRYNLAGITQEWWEFELEHVEEDFNKDILNDVRIFCENAKASILNKFQFWFYGYNGRGKTTMAILMVKAVIQAGYKAKLIKASEVLQYLYKQEIDELDELDFIVIDELDKLSLRDTQIKDFSNVVSDYIDKKSIVFISNNSIDKMTEYPLFFIDRLKALTLIEFKDNINYRQSYKSNFESFKDRLNEKD